MQLPKMKNCITIPQKKSSRDCKEKSFHKISYLSWRFYVIEVCAWCWKLKLKLSIERKKNMWILWDKILTCCEHVKASLSQSFVIMYLKESLQCCWPASSLSVKELETKVTNPNMNNYWTKKTHFVQKGQSMTQSSSSTQIWYMSLEKEICQDITWEGQN